MLIFLVKRMRRATKQNSNTNLHKIANTIFTSQTFVPRKVFFAVGKASHEDPLISFELALRDAGIEKFNLVQVTSVLPFGCEVIDKSSGLKELTPGQIVFCVMARKTSNEAGKKIYATIGVAMPNKPSQNGYLTEYYGYYTDENVEEYAEHAATLMFESAFGEKPLKSFSVSSKAVVEKNKHTTVVAAAILLL